MKDLISIDDININQIDEVHRLANQYFLNPHQHYDDLKEKILATDTYAGLTTEAKNKLNYFMDHHKYLVSFKDDEINEIYWTNKTRQ